MTLRKASLFCSKMVLIWGVRTNQTDLDFEAFKRLKLAYELKEFRDIACDTVESR